MSHHPYISVLSFRADWAVEVGVEGAVILDTVARRMHYSAASDPPFANDSEDRVWVYFSDAWVETELPFLGADGFRRECDLLSASGALLMQPWGDGGVSLTIIDARLYEAPYARTDRVPAAEPVSGYVYLLRSDHGLYKIGRSIEPASRIRRLGVVLPFPVTTIHVLAADDCSTAERRLHMRFASQRLEGEWFRLTDDDVAWVKSIQHCEKDLQQ